MPKGIDLPNKFLRALYKWTDENEIEVSDDELWKFANTLALIANPKKFSDIYNQKD